MSQTLLLKWARICELDSTHKLPSILNKVSNIISKTSHFSFTNNIAEMFFGFSSSCDIICIQNGSLHVKISHFEIFKMPFFLNLWSGFYETVTKLTFQGNGCISGETTVKIVLLRPSGKGPALIGKILLPNSSCLEQPHFRRWFCTGKQTVSHKSFLPCKKR